MATLKVPDLSDLNVPGKVGEKVGDLGSYLKEQRENARLSLRQLASVAGVSNPYLSQIERGLRKPSAEVLQQIAKGLQISAEAMFQRAGLLENAGGVDVEAAIHSDVRLTSRQKRVLLDIYGTFRAENSRTEAAVTAAEAAAEQERASAQVAEALGSPGDPAGAGPLEADPGARGAAAPVVALVPDPDAPGLPGTPGSPATTRAAKPRTTARKRASKRAATRKVAGEG